MPYTKSLTKLTDIADMKIAKVMSESDVLQGKVQKLLAIKNELYQELETCRIELRRLINAKLASLKEYYKLRSEISVHGSRIVIIETRIDNIDSDIRLLNNEIEKLYQETIKLKRKKKKYNRILQEGI